MQAIADTKEEIYELIDRVPGEELIAIRRFVEFVLAQVYDDEELSPEGIALLEEGRRSLENETVYTHEQVRAELGL
ncbi:MAG: hypothetical protein M3Y07_10025 [Acidobacteriota bacterium]|nr:hypothetical protein [Acidobacteriota bacterium]